MGLALMLVGATTTGVLGLNNNRTLDAGERVLVDRHHPTDIEHVAQDNNDCARTPVPTGECVATLNNLSNQRVNGQASERFTEAFELGDELFSMKFNGADGGGANVGNGERYTRVPRADLTGAGQWATHTPSRATGPNAASCDACHDDGGVDGAGVAAKNVHRDPNHTGRLNGMIQRNTPHLLGLAGLQVAAEEITAGLQADRQRVIDEACARGGTRSGTLSSHGISYGSISVTRTGSNPCRFTVNTGGVQGVSADLVVRPFQWKGVEPTVRSFVRGAMHNELGVQAVEMAGDNSDGDGDGVRNELTIGDITALAVYMAFQPRPTTLQELTTVRDPDTGQPLATLTPAQNAQINNGRARFTTIGCAACHMPSVETDERMFREPSASASHRDTTFPAGQNPGSRGVTPNNAIVVDITRDGPDNAFPIPNGGGDTLGNFRRAGFDGARIDAFTDFKRHNLGFEVAEQIDEVGTGASTFMTRSLWGIASSGPYMHDGRATTLTEAILYHGGEAATSRSNFLNLGTTAQGEVLAFLNNLVLFTVEEEE
jgi:hypothetical protein